MEKSIKQISKLKAISILCCVLIICALFICVIIQNTNNKKIVINNGIVKYLDKLNFQSDEYQLKKFSDYKNVTVKNIPTDITQDEIDEYIKTDLESHERNVKLKRNIIHKNDVVNVQYTVECEGEIVNKISDESFMIGAGKYNEQIENALIGKNINKEIVFDIKVPENDSNTKFAGKIETIHMKVKSLYKVKSCKLTKKFVKDNYNLNSIEEYYKYVNTILQEQKENENYRNININILNTVCECYDLEIDKEDVADYSVDIVNKYKEYAYIDGISLETYINNVLNMSQEEFYQMCYDEGLKELKSIIVIGAIAEEEKIYVTENEIDK